MNNTNVKDAPIKTPDDRHDDHPRKVKITINGKEYETLTGITTVERLKHLGKVPSDEILSEFKHGQWVDLKDDERVNIHGGEVFASHIKSCGSS